MEPPPPEGVITCCSRCGRPLGDQDLWGDPCGCGGTLSHSEDALTMQIRRLEAIRQARSSIDVVEGPATVRAL